MVMPPSRVNLKVPNFSHESPLLVVKERGFDLLLQRFGRQGCVRPPGKHGTNGKALLRLQCLVDSQSVLR